MYDGNCTRRRAKTERRLLFSPAQRSSPTPISHTPIHDWHWQRPLCVLDLSECDDLSLSAGATLPPKNALLSLRRPRPAAGCHPGEEAREDKKKEKEKDREKKGVVRYGHIGLTIFYYSCITDMWIPRILLFFFASNCHVSAMSMPREMKR